MPRSSGQSATPSRAIRSTDRPMVSRAVELRRSVALADDAHDRLQRRRLARAVAAEQRDDLARAHVEIDAVQDVRFAVPGLQALDVEHRRSRGAARAEAASAIPDPHDRPACTSGFSDTVA